jgi:hypothetical protein
MAPEAQDKQAKQGAEDEASAEPAAYPMDKRKEKPSDTIDASS